MFFSANLWSTEDSTAPTVNVLGLWPSVSSVNTHCIASPHLIQWQLTYRSPLLSGQQQPWGQMWICLYLFRISVLLRLWVIYSPFFGVWSVFILTLIPSLYQRTLCCVRTNYYVNVVVEVKPLGIMPPNIQLIELFYSCWQWGKKHLVPTAEWNLLCSYGK